MKGILYIALGDKYLEMAVESAISVIDSYSGKCPNIRILSNRSHKHRLNDYSSNIIQIEQINIDIPFQYDIAVAYLKTLLTDISPFSQTLYLDCDTKAISNISDIWQYSSGGISMASAYNPIRRKTIYPSNPEATETSFCLSVVGDYTQYNTGVILFKKSRHISKIFRMWHQEWKRFKRHENMAFTRLTTYGIPVNRLPAKYNQFYPDLNNDTLLIHYVGNYKQYL